MGVESNCVFIFVVLFLPGIMHPGAYAISIDAEMPDDILDQLEENGIRRHRILATALKDKDKS